MKKLLATFFFAAPALALAHTGHDHSGFLSGALHPVGGLDHILAMLAVGLWAASFGGKARWVIPASFVGAMAVGFLLGAQGFELPLLEAGIAASVLVIGLAAAWAKQLPAAAAAIIVGAFALFHGVAHGAEMGDGSAAAYAAGFVLTTVLLHAAGFFAGSRLGKNVWLSRTIGSAIGIAGLGLLLA